MVVNVLLLALLASDGPSRQTLDLAARLLRDGYTGQAALHYEEAATEPVLAETACGLAEARLQQGRHAEALAALQRVAAAQRGADWYRLAAEIHAGTGDYTLALDAARAAVAADPEQARSRYVLGHLYEVVGDLPRAVETYRPFNELFQARFPEDAVVLHYGGLGFYRYSVLQRVDNLAYRTKYVLQDVLQKACMVIDLGYWPARLAIADLLNTKHRDEEAVGDYAAVLQHNPNALGAHLGLGRIAMKNWDFAGVERRVDVCLDLNPRSVDALVLLAELRMTERRYEDAAAVTDRALRINPNDLAALGYRSAALLRLGRTAEADAVLAHAATVNPCPAVVHTIVGKQLSDARQFPEAEAQFRLALVCDPSAATPPEELAMMYMQWGREDQARTTAEAAFERDSFNRRIYNTLDLLDRLAAFGSRSTAHFDIHFDPAHDAVMGVVMGDYLESIYDELLADFDTTLPERTIIEVFPDHQAFGVRIHGKPWIHTIGACTGRVIAMDAPRAGVSGPYHYANVLRHEFTHTVTLAATNNRIPHWLTEGLAVLQEDQPRSWEWMKQLANRLRDDTLFAIDRIDWGFIRPQRPDDRQVAYAQSEWMCEFLIERWGYDIINTLLQRVRDGEVLQAILPDLTGHRLAEFDDAFRGWARQQAQGWGLPLTPPNDSSATRWLLRWYPRSDRLQAAHAVDLLERGDAEAALDAALTALEWNDASAAATRAAARAHGALAQGADDAETRQRHAEAARALLEDLARLDPQDPLAPEYLAEWAIREDDLDGAERWASRLKQLQPLNPTSYRVLSTVYLQRGDDDNALPELLARQQHEDHDADVPRQLAELYLRRGRRNEAAYWLREAVFIDAYDVETHRTLGTLLLELGRPTDAEQAYRTVTLLEPQSARSHSDLALLYQRLGDRDRAEAAARRAVELDPQTPARHLVPR